MLKLSDRYLQMSFVVGVPCLIRLYLVVIRTTVSVSRHNSVPDISENWSLNLPFHPTTTAKNQVPTKYLEINETAPGKF